MTNDAESTVSVSERRKWWQRFRLSQETIAIIGLAGLFYLTTADIRDDARVARVAWEKRTAEIDARAQSDREAWEAEARAIRAENRADREAWERRIAEIVAAWRDESRHFQSEILRLTAETARLAARDRDTTAEPERPTAGTTATPAPATVDRDRSRPMARPMALRPS